MKQLAKTLNLIKGRIRKEKNFLKDCLTLRRAMRQKQKTILLDYMMDMDTVPRYGYGKPVHKELCDILESNRSKYAELLESFLQFTDELAKIAIDPPDDPREPYWDNSFLRSLDPVSLYGMLCIYDPKKYIEIGSGNSTKWAKKAITNRNLDTQIISIDPYPRAEINELCDVVIRDRLQDTNLDIFDELQSGDIVFMDGSHYCFTNFDVTVFFLEILPKLRPGVIIFIHDIYIPSDYPPEWSHRYYSEQYLLAVLLMAARDRYEVLLPCQFIHADEQLRQTKDKIWEGLKIKPGAGSGFWMKVR